MSYLDAVRGLRTNPAELESTYRQAVQVGEASAFAEAIEANYAEDSSSLLMAAWHYRLQAAVGAVKEHVIAWAWVLPLAVVNGLVLWGLFNSRFDLAVFRPGGGQGETILPLIFLVAGPVSAALIALGATALAHRPWRYAALALVPLAALVIYVLLAYPRILPVAYQQQYVILSAANLTGAAWFALAYALLAGRDSTAARFGLLAKSLETVVVGGFLGVVGGVLTAVSVGLFDALSIQLPDPVVRLVVAGGLGFIAVVAAGVAYDPQSGPEEQSFDEGMSTVTAMLLRLLLPFALIVLVLFLGFLPFNYRAPLDNRSVLVIFNATLFAAMALLVGITPVSARTLDQRTSRWLRAGTVALAVLALVVGVYALGAILYRTSLGQLTPNRLTFIGWNVINVCILAALLWQQARAGADRWLQAVQRTLAAAIVPYGAWVILGIVAMPWLFRMDTQGVSQLPETIQNLAYEQPAPILMHCVDAPEIYLLERGTKRWIKDIPTFKAQGFVWDDVRYVPCDDLAAVPLGTPIPPDAGEPPPR